MALLAKRIIYITYILLTFLLKFCSISHTLNTRPCGITWISVAETCSIWLLIRSYTNTGKPNGRSVSVYPW